MGKQTLVSVSKADFKKMQAKIKSIERRKAKQSAKRQDGLTPHLVAKIRGAVRQVWQRSYPRRLCAERAALPGGFSQCEGCFKRVPRVYIDHIVAVGDLDGGFIERLFCGSPGLQALCQECHDSKTAQERRDKRVLNKRKSGGPAK